MRHSILLALPFTLLLLVPSLRAQDDDAINPDRPGIADGSTTLKRGAFQIETGAERDDRDDSRTLFTPTLFRYGLAEHFELRVETLGYERVTGGPLRLSGMAPVTVGFKYHFLDGDDAGHPSLGVIVRLQPPSGSGEFHDDHTGGDVRLVADLQLGKRWALNPNVGFAFDGGDRSALAALTVQYNVTETLNVFADTGITKPLTGDDNTSVLLDAGAALVIGRNTQLDTSIGWGARGSDVPNVFVAAGVSRRF